MDTVLRSDILKILDTGEPFDMEFVTADRRRGTGGKLITVKGWVKQKEQPVEDRPVGQHTPAKQRLVKDPAHRKNGTINIKNPGNKHVHPHKVHVALILTLNGKKVING